MKKSFKNGLFLVVIIGILVGLGACNPEEILGDPVDLPPTVVISKPTNNQICSPPFDIVGNTYHDKTISNLTVYFTPVFGGSTNIYSGVITPGNLSTFRTEITNINKGYYYVWAEARDIKNIGGDSALLLINIEDDDDLIAPTVNIISPTANQEVGATFTFSGTVSDNDSGVQNVYVKTDNNSYKVIPVINGNWSTNITLTVKGNHECFVYASDKAGNISPAKSVIVNYPSGMPSVVISSPVSGIMTNASVLKVEGSASVESPSLISKVQLNINSTGYRDVQVLTYSEPGVKTFRHTNISLQEGTNRIVARAISDNSKTNTSATLVLFRDTIAPSCYISKPVSNSSTTNKTLKVQGTASDSGSGLEGVYLAINDNTFSKVDSSANWSFEMVMNVGSYTIKVFSKDQVGNVSFTNEVSVTITSGGGGEDTTPPTLTISVPTEGHSQTDATLAVSGTCSDTGGVEGVYISYDSGSYKKLVGTEVWSTNITMVVGAHTVKMYARDIAGNNSAVQTVNVTRNSAGSTITIHYENGNDWATPMMHWGFGYYLEVSDLEPDGNDQFGSFYEVDWSASSETTLSCCFNNGSGSWDGSDRTVSKPGSFPSEVWIKTSDSTIYTENPNDIQAPVVAMTAPTSGITVSNYVTLEATASDNVGVTKVEFYDGLVKIEEDATSPYSIIWNTTLSVDGSHSVKARAYDAAGNYSDSDPITLFTENTNVPPVADAGSDFLIVVSNEAQFDASGSYDPNGSIVSYQWNNGLIGVNPTKVYNTVGEYTVTLTVTDNEGATDTDTVTVTVSTQRVETAPFSWDNATVYFVITDRFYNGNTGNDHSYGRQNDGQQEIGTFHGGDLAGLTAKLNEGYFTDLGINAIWITSPYEQIHGWVAGGDSGDFKHYAYHGYYVLDYTMIDQNMGTTNELKEFIDTAHSLGIRVIFDIVMNHAGYNTYPDMVDYHFGGLYSGWESAGPQNFHDYINYETQDWGNWWGPAWIRTGLPGGYDSPGGDDQTSCLAYLPDFKTEADSTPVHLPVFYQYKTDTRAVDMYGSGWSVRDYLINWLCDWVETYGVDGFRCDTAKHVELAAWQELKDNANTALANWKSANPSKALDDLPFWMTGEVWGYGVGRSSYFDNGFDSIINFDFSGAAGNAAGGNYSAIEGTYSSYASQINSDPTMNALSYISSHDTGIFYNGDATRQKRVGTLLLLCPGGIQVFYGDESCRSFGATGSDPDQGTRSSMSWPGNTDVIAHWQKVGQFRNNHLAVGAGTHSQISSSPYTFSRVYNQDGYVDKVVCVLGASGSTSVNVSSVFSDGVTLRDAYSGNTATVSGVNVTFTPSGDVLLIESAD